jgi:hypothetical protein
MNPMPATDITVMQDDPVLYCPQGTTLSIEGVLQHRQRASFGPIERLDVMHRSSFGARPYGLHDRPKNDGMSKG